jgi:hypothetical protein
MRPRRSFSPEISVLLFIVLGILASWRIDIAHSGADVSGSTIPPEPIQHTRDILSNPEAYPTIAHSAGYIVPMSQFLATIFYTAEERQGIAAGDHVVIDAGAAKHVQVGDWFTIVRSSASIRHPVTNRVVGTLVTTLGYATAVRVQPSTTVLQITKTFDTVEVGDQVTKFETPQSQGTNAAFSSPTREIKGFIVATKDDRVMVGEGDIVYLDQGEKQGVRIGDHFRVLREGGTIRHPATQRLIRLPRQVFGELTVLDVREHTSTALAIASRREFSVGTPVELQATQDRRLIEAEATPTDDSSSEQGAQTEARVAQIVPCLEATRQALHAAEAAGATQAELAPALSALASAEHRLEQAKAFLSQGDVEQARSQLDAAQADCLTAQELSRQANIIASSRTPAPDHYTVQQGNTLWGISAQETIYHNPFMWPMIYKANRDQIRDPDLISPKQRVTIPRDFSQEEANTAIRRAQRRGPWHLGDGPDVYVLEGVR